MSEPEPLRFQMARAEFFHIGRALQRGFGRDLLGEVLLEVSAGQLRIASQFGGSVIACEGDGSVSARITAKHFCTLVTTRCREKQPAGKMEIVFDPTLREISIDRAGVKARFKK